MIIDCHCHAGAGDGFTGPWDTAAPLGAYLRRARAAGIAKTVLFPAFHTDYSRANREVAGIVARNPGRFIGFAFVNPVADAGRVREMVGEAVHHFGFRGIKCHHHDGRLTREVCEAAAAFGVPILYDAQGDVSLVDLVAPEFPSVQFIVPHLGSFADDWKAQRQLIDILVRHRNVVTDTSGVRRFDLIVEAVRRAGPDRVLFGTDGPWLHPGLELAKIRALGLPAAEEALITGGNIARILGRSPAVSTGNQPFRWYRPRRRRIAGGPPTAAGPGAVAARGR